MSRIWIALGALFGAVSVAMAAYASHGLPPERGTLAMTGASLGAWHALALILTGLLAERRRGVAVHVAGACLAAGVLMFCGGVFLRALAGVSIGLVTPAGGIALMAGWLMLAVAAFGRPR